MNDENETEKAKCADCGDMVDADTLSGDHCESCAESYFSCEDCDSVKHENDLVSIAASRENGIKHGLMLCDSCVEAYPKCDDCDERAAQDHISRAANGNDICNNCYLNDYFTCDSCSDIYPTNDLCSTDSGDSYCNDCYDNSDENDSQGSFEKLQATSFKINPRKRLVGFELEFCYKGSLVRRSDHGIFEDDGSIHANEGTSDATLEFASHAANGDKLVTLVDGITSELRGAEAYVNQSCGFHVHVDCRDIGKLGAEKLYFWFQAFEPIFQGMVSASRLANTYCKPINDPSGYQIYSDRYRTLNLCSFSEHGTLEFRLHQGTLNAEKILNWSYLLADFVEYFQHIPTEKIDEIRTLSMRGKFLVLLKTLNIKLSLAKYMLRRIKEMNEGKAPEKRLTFPAVDYRQLSLNYSMNQPNESIDRLPPPDYYPRVSHCDTPNCSACADSNREQYRRDL